MSQVNARHDLQEVLQTVAEGVADVAGFAVAAIRYLHPDGTLEMVALAGDDEARDQLLGSRKPVDEILDEFRYAEEWGVLQFVPHERLPGHVGAGWVPNVEPIDAPNAWHPQDALYAPLSGPTGELVGMLGVDLPHDGLRPGQFQRDVLEMYAVQAGIAISNAKQRNRLVEQVRLSTAVRAIVHTAGHALDLGRVIDDSVQPLLSGLRCHGLWVRAFEGEGDLPGLGRGAVHPAGSPRPDPELIALIRRIATDCWRERRAVVVSGTTRPSEGLVSADELEAMQRFIGQIGARRLLVAPMGAGPECLGYLALGRTEDGPAWSEDEVDAALEIGRDLGRAVLHARLFERERELVENLQDLDRYKTDLIATIAHELRNPLTSVVGHVEMLQTMVTTEAAQRSLTAIARNSERLESMVEDLLLLSKVGDPNRPLIPMQVDMCALLHENLEMFCLQAQQQGVALRFEDGGAPALAWGEPAELDRLVGNIVGNAVKYTPEGGSVTLALEVTGQVVTFECRDEGLGISPQDQERMFTEFYRSTDPEALALPGTGLGLTIVKRIVDRHRGTITVDSELGVGSTFTVTLPGPPERPSARPSEELVEEVAELVEELAASSALDGPLGRDLGRVRRL